jgi:septum formation protein
MAGYQFDVVEPDVEEARHPDEPAQEYVMRLATEKASAVAATQLPGTCVIGFDTSVVLDGQILGKPGDEDEATAMLLSLGGRSHIVYTGSCLQIAGTAEMERGIDAARVTMRSVSPGEAREYAATGEPMDKAGAYALQGRGRGFVTDVTGWRSTVIGLPLESVVEMLAERGITPVRGVGEGVDGV